MSKTITGAELIAQERQRQIEIEGYNLQRDVDEYSRDQLKGAALCYLVNAFTKSRPDLGVKASINNYIGDNVDPWPWDEKYDKRVKHDALRSLVISGALIAAEIDRLLTPPPQINNL